MFTIFHDLFYEPDESSPRLPVRFPSITPKHYPAIYACILQVVFVKKPVENIGRHCFEYVLVSINWSKDDHFVVRENFRSVPPLVVTLISQPVA
jgi:hypothetical protein